MSEIQNLKSELTRWLVEDEIESSEVENKDADFQLILSNAFGLGFTIDIAKLKGKPILDIVIKLTNSSAIQQGFASLTDEESMMLLENLKRELLRLGVDYNLSVNIDTVTLIKFVYLENMTRTLFMESVKLVRNAALIVISTLSQRFESGYESTPPHSHLHVSSPYG